MLQLKFRSQGGASGGRRQFCEGKSIPAVQGPIQILRRWMERLDFFWRWATSCGATSGITPLSPRAMWERLIWVQATSVHYESLFPPMTNLNLLMPSVMRGEAHVGINGSKRDLSALRVLRSFTGVMLSPGLRLQDKPLKGLVKNGTATSSRSLLDTRFPKPALTVNFMAISIRLVGFVTMK